ncbi:hypothetical protein [Candidatus Formimonas warabiya]|uniref:hypothetical protein n=1 Tax=Formimonas warabiya TaxID=1761012 RepID=UPI001BE4D101|nr:hypothetical protein [Candidatus Formimonas warabiya]
MAKGSGFDEALEAEVEKRADIISDPSYAFVPAVTKQDGIYIVVFMIACLALLAYGVL